MFARCRLALAVLAACFLSIAPAHATWSIVIVNKVTGEVAIGSATCLTDLDLKDFVPVMLVGVGGAAAQSQIDSNAQNRQLIWDEMRIRTHPRDIIDLLEAQDSNHQSRQYGIVDMLGRRQSFTGRRASDWAGGLTGRDGPFRYAIQGNLLTGEPVVLDAETALLNTQGDIAEKLMAAMEAAAAQGGDARCTNDGKSAHIGFMLVSRLGDIDGTCNRNIGCANGTYYMDLNVANQRRFDPDPVLQLRTQFDTWRDSWRGRPDHILSTKTWSDDAIPGNGTATTTLTLDLIDWEGMRLGRGGDTVLVRHALDSARLSTIGDVVDHGDGTYSVPITAGVGQGVDLFEVQVRDAFGPVQLAPNAALTLGETLTANVTDLSAAVGGTVDFSMVGPEASPGRDYLLLTSASGTDPGLDLGSITLPLNFDSLLLISFRERNGSTWVNSFGTLADNGAGNAQFTVPAGVLDAFVGAAFSFAYMTLDPVDFPSNPVTIDITP